MTLHATLEAGKDTADNRAAQRKTLRLATSSRTPAGPPGDVLVHDLSAGGLLIESATRLADGETLAVELPGSGSHEAVVMWSSNQFYGCRFAKPLPASAMSAALLKALPADPAAERRLTSAEPSLADRLSALRRVRNWTMEQLAAQLNVSRQSVWYWESGQRQPKPQMIRKMAALFEISERELRQSTASEGPLSDDMQTWKALIADRLGVAPDKVRILIEV
jgi:transcriptional regulator with XRE-family HTH domain